MKIVFVFLFLFSLTACAGMVKSEFETHWKIPADEQPIKTP